MKSIDQKKAKRRTTLLALLSLLWLIVLLFRLFDLQVVNTTLYKTKSIEQSKNRRPILPKRGSIYDRNGVILARSLPSPSISYRPVIEESLSVQMTRIKKLKPLLGLSQSDLNDIRGKIKKGDGFIWIKRKIHPKLAEKILSLEITGVGEENETKRYYPHDTLASHVIGAVDIDDKGTGGIEYAYDSILGGVRGERYIFRDALRRAFQYETLQEPVHGRDLKLSLDETVQYIAAKEIKAAVQSTESLWGTVILMSPTTGEILAMANYPNFDPNETQSSTRNNAIHYTYAPGSTFKIITASAAIENELVQLGETFDCSEGSIRIPGKTVRDHKTFGILTFPEVIINSSNVGIIQIAQKIGPDVLNKTISDYGFVSKTGIDLPGEERGLIQPFESWTKSSVPSLSMGYEINVTPLQMLQALNMIANNGLSIPPRIVLDKSTWVKNRTENDVKIRQVLTESTARALAEILEATVSSGTGKSASIPGYIIAGKTGTAQKYDPGSYTYLSSAHIASFMGYIRTDRPLFSMIVVLDDPKGFYYGSQVAAPVFKRILQQVLRYFRIPPSIRPQERIVEPQSQAGDQP